jgi:RNA 2',3'-cyclic 3'-phosphodiesterase
MTSSSSKRAEQGLAARPPQARVFVGLKITPEIATELAQLATLLKEQPVRLVKPADIHLTLVPPWNEASIPDAIEKLDRIAGRFGAFWLIFQHLGYGAQPRRPRLLWADCAATEEIIALHAALVQAYGQTDDRPFQPHVTLARIRTHGSAIARRHQIDQPLSLRQCVRSLELFQSPPPGETGYRVLASLPLGKP